MHAHRHSAPPKGSAPFFDPCEQSPVLSQQPPGGGSWKSPCAPAAVRRGSQICTARWRSYVLPGVIENNLSNYFHGLELLLELLLFLLFSFSERAQQRQT